jgi:hypothetical protein
LSDIGLSALINKYVEAVMIIELKTKGFDKKKPFSKLLLFIKQVDIPVHILQSYLVVELNAHLHVR